MEWILYIVVPVVVMTVIIVLLDHLDDYFKKNKFSRNE
jgi:type IV secretory pathway VirB6-like protein